MTNEDIERLLEKDRAYSQGYARGLEAVLDYIFVSGTWWNETTIQRKPLIDFINERKRLYDSS